MCAAVTVPTTAPDALAALQATVREQAAALSRRDAEIMRLREEIRLLLAQRFGASSERVLAAAGQYELFNEAEAHVPAEDARPDAATVTVAEHTRRGHRKPLPVELPREIIVHDVPEAAKVCPHDGTLLERIGEDISEQLDIIPAQIRVLLHQRLKYACPCCRQHGVTAPLPAQPIPKSQASPGLLAHVATAKYVDAIPLYRQCTQLERIGVQMSRQTLAAWMVRVGALGQPLINLLREVLLDSGYVQMDETPVQVLKEPGKPAQSKSYMWVQRCGGLHPVVLFDYDPRRSGSVPVRLLGDFAGYLQTDGYAGYDAVIAANAIQPLNCMAHVRRYFTDALKAIGVNPAKVSNSPPEKAHRLLKALTFIRHLYAIEHRIRDAAPAQRYAARQAQALPVLAQFQDWARDIEPSVLPTSGLSKALQYLNARWPQVSRYCADGRLEIDNNLCENAIRPFVVGKNNFLFCDTVAGATASANLYSLIQTAKANGLEPYGYLRTVFTALPAATTLDDIERLLPWNCKPPPGG